MKQHFFEFHLGITAKTIELIGNISEWLADACLTIGIFLQTAVARVGYKTTAWIYPKNLQEAEKQIETAATNIELSVLFKVTELKEHAIRTGEWTESHSEAMNALGNALVNECDWKEDDMHSYIKKVVESVPGLRYGE